MKVTFMFIFWLLFGFFIGYIALFCLIHLNEQDINSLKTANRRLRHHAYQALEEAAQARAELDITRTELKRRKESNGQ